MASIRGTSVWAARVAGAKQAKMDHVGSVNAMFLHQDKSLHCSEKRTYMTPVSTISHLQPRGIIACQQW